jgi:hypothetical protein
MSHQHGHPARIATLLLVALTLGLTACLGSPARVEPAAELQEVELARRPEAEGPLDAPPVEPPDVSKITVGPAGSTGVATISGAAGTVPAGVTLAVVNLSSRNVITATANSSGAFSTNLFAPAGSTLLVKYGDDPEPFQLMWQSAMSPAIPAGFSYINPLPGASFYVDGPRAEQGTQAGAVTPFYSAGFFGDGQGAEWAGWWLAGEMTWPGPGGQVVVNGTFHATSPALNCANPPPFTPQIHFTLRSQYGPDGTARLGSTWFNAFLFTPTGLPIEHEAPAERRPLGSTAIAALACDGQQTIVGQFSHSADLPPGITDGVYQVEGWMDDGGLPLAAGLPRVTIWFHDGPVAMLVPLAFGTPAPPQIPWTLLANYAINGHQGLTAEEDRGRYQLLPRSIYPPHRVAVPMLDERTGAPIVYRLEPGSNWISSTDRRFAKPPDVPFDLPGGSLQVTVNKPDGSHDVLGPAPIAQSSVRTPSLADGMPLHEGTGHPGDIYHLYAGDDSPFAYAFDQYGPHTITLNGYVQDIYGNQYPFEATYPFMVARILDLDPAQLPTTPFKQGDAFAAGLHVFPPVPAALEIRLLHLPNSDPAQAQEIFFNGQANRFGYFQPPAGTVFRFTSPGEFRVDISAEYEAPDGTLWAGYATWGNVVENASPLIAAHGRRGMDYHSNTIDDMPLWFFNANLPPDKVGIENYYPYLSGDVHWGSEVPLPVVGGDSIHSIITLRDLTGPAETIYNLLRLHYPRATNTFRWPPDDLSLAGLEKRLDIGEAPLFMTTSSGRDPTIYPDEIDLWGYTYTSSERPDVHVREIITEDGMGTAYWRFNDTYGAQIGEPADGDQPGDIKWEFGGIVFRVPGENVNQYAIYSSLWVLLPPECDAYGCTRVTPPFQDATGAGINGGPLLSLLGQEVDMLFLPKGIRPGDVLEVGDTVAFSGHVGPPLDSRVEVTITSPTGVVRSRTWHANKIGWLYDPTFDFVANEPGRWRVQVQVVHDRPYAGNGVTPQSHNTGRVLGTSANGQFDFYVVQPESPWLLVTAPRPGVITWPNQQIEPIEIRGLAPAGTTAVRYTIHDKGIVMAQGQVVPVNGVFSLVYNATVLHELFPMLSLTAHEAIRPGLADVVSIHLLAVGGPAAANTVTLIGEEIFIGRAAFQTALPVVVRP